MSAFSYCGGLRWQLYWLLGIIPDSMYVLRHVSKRTKIQSRNDEFMNCWWSIFGNGGDVIFKCVNVIVTAITNDCVIFMFKILSATDVQRENCRSYIAIEVVSVLTVGLSETSSSSASLQYVMGSVFSRVVVVVVLPELSTYPRCHRCSCYCCVWMFNSSNINHLSMIRLLTVVHYGVWTRSVWGTWRRWSL